MAEVLTITEASPGSLPEAPTSESNPLLPAAPRPSRPRGPPLREIYALPIPIRTFPLPSFYPSNPLSLLHIAYVWLSQTLAPPLREPSTVHRGVWSASTRSVHITEPRSIRALWEQGFYGKGNLSRSEPNWLKRELRRLGLGDEGVSEVHTVERRNERIEAKWERARVEQEAIERAKRLEAETGSETGSGVDGDGDEGTKANDAALKGLVLHGAERTSEKYVAENHAKADGKPNGHATEVLSDKPLVNGHRGANGLSKAVHGAEALRDIPLQANGIQSTEAETPSAQVFELTKALEDESAVPQSTTEASGSLAGGVMNEDIGGSLPLKRRKSVRFSADIQSTVFINSDPPSPVLTAPALVKGAEVVPINGVLSRTTRFPLNPGEAPLPLVLDKEHLQLSPEEAFFLVFALGVLEVVDPDSDNVIPTSGLLSLFRSHSYFPPRIRLSDPGLQPDDPFLVRYAAYHHFRSLGWVVRDGIKFGVDWLLYLRGPVFNHAEFGIIIMPSYTGQWWKENPHRKREKGQKTWSWLHGTMRVMSHVLKTFVLVYVDVPNPEVFKGAVGYDERGREGGFAKALRLYGIREVMVRRWSSNRNR
jgi:tRNA-splicing endonuclease subunit Sen2